MTTSDNADRRLSRQVIGLRATRRASAVERELRLGTSAPRSATRSRNLERRDVAWLDAAGDGCALWGLSAAWRRRPVMLSAAGPWPDLSRVRVAVVDLEEALPKQVVELVEGNPQLKWIALIAAEQLADPQVREFIGACCYDFHTLPLDHARLEATLGRAYGMAALEARSGARLRPADGGRETPMLGQSPAMARLKRVLTRVARSDVPVLVRGEAGTGRTLVAQTLHRKSRRAAGPFVVVDCGASPPEAVALELFGHEPGAFAGAVERRPGQLERADGGTLLLQDVEALSPVLQVQLLHFLEAGVSWRLGGLEPVKPDVRLLVATQDRLDAAVDSGRFRADLCYRLNVVELALPPLRERGADLMRLARFHLEHCAADRDGPRGFSQAATAAMSRHAWPGNVSELVARIARSVSVAENRLLRPEDLGFEPTEPPGAPPLTLAESRNRAERESVERALRQCADNVSRAARQLGIGRVTLYRLLKKHGIGSSERR